RLRARARLRPGRDRPLRDRDRLPARRKSHANFRLRDPAVDTARIPVLDRPQFQGTRRRPRAGAGAGALSARIPAQQRARYPRQRRGCRHDRLCCPQMAGAVMSDFIGDWHALVVLLLAGVIPNQIWRLLGLWLGAGLDEGSDLLMWVKAVATAILAGVIAQILVQPPGALASIPSVLRYGALAAGFVAFMLTRRSIFAGVLAGEIVMLAGKWWLG